MSKVAYIKDGQFYDIKGFVVPMVVGDADQIKLLRAYNEFDEDPPQVEFSARAARVDYRAEFVCACGDLVAIDSADFNVDIDDLHDMDEHDFADELRNKKGQCHRCKSWYQLTMDRNREYSIKRLSIG